MHRESGVLQEAGFKKAVSFLQTPTFAMCACAVLPVGSGPGLWRADVKLGVSSAP